MRLFIAIPTPEEVKDYLLSVQSILKRSGADVKWVSKQNIHLTLKFLGEINDKESEQIPAILDGIVNNIKVYNIGLGKPGAFPKTGSARTLWVGIEEGEKETQALAAQIEDQLSKLGIPKEKRGFSCHITIGRVRSFLGSEELSRLIQDLAKESSTKKILFEVSKIVLFKSTLGPAGPVYEALSEANLNIA